MSEIESNPEKRIALFQRKEVRRVIHDNEWWFVVEDGRVEIMQEEAGGAFRKLYGEFLPERSPTNLLPPAANLVSAT